MRVSREGANEADDVQNALKFELERLGNTVRSLQNDLADIRMNVQMTVDKEQLLEKYVLA